MSAPRLVEGHVVGGKYSIRSVLRHSEVIATYHAVAAPNLQVALKLFDPALHRHLGVVAQLADVYRKLETLRSDWFGHVIDAGRDEETGATFTATMLVATPALAELVSLCPFDEAESTNLVVALARALDAAHAVGLVHGGLSASNVFPGATPYASCKLVDFGIHLARRTLARPHDDPVTAQWLAPEQVDQSAASVATDVFALALLAFFAMTGRSYWRSCRGTPDVATWGRELREARTPASVLARELSVSIDPALDAVFERALAMAPADRFPSAGTFAAAFCDALGREADLAPLGALPAVESKPVTKAAEPYVAVEAPPVEQPAAPVAAQLAVAEPDAGTMPAAALETAAAMGAPASRAELLATPIDDAPVARRSRAAWIAVPVILAISAGAAAMILMSGRTAPVTAPAASETAPPKAPPVVAAVEDDVPDAALVGASKAMPDTGPDVAPAHDAAADARDGGTGKEIEVKIWCNPACDWMQINGKPVDPKEQLRLVPGKYIIAVGKTGYVSQSDILYVRAGKKAVMPFALLRVGAKPPCGKFLKRCD